MRAMGVMSPTIQKTLSVLTILAATSCAFAINAANEPPSPLPTAAAAARLDMHAIEHETRYEYDRDGTTWTVAPTIATSAELTIVGPAPKAPGKVWTCSEPRALANDASQTVRVCEWQ